MHVTEPKVTKKPPIDQENRRRVAGDLSTNLSVEAAAGTGKTTLLVDRFMAIITGGADIDRIVAITFTEKAAEELQERIRQRLEDELSGYAGANDAAESTAGTKDQLEKALTGLEGAHISTIHSFAAAILRERPVEANVPPGFRMMDRIEQDLLFERVWSDFVDEEFSRADCAIERELGSGLTLASLEQMARALHERRDVFLDAPLPAGGTAEGFVAFLREVLPELQSLAGSARDENDVAVRKVRDLAGLLGRLEGLGPVERDEAVLSAARIKGKGAIGNKGKWRGAEDELARVRELLDGLQDALDESQQAVASAMLARIATWIRGFLDRLEGEKRRSEVLDFNDLLIKARDLLRDDTVTRAHFQRRFSHILVDEFQDTDPLQAEIVFFLAEKAPTAQQWRDVELVPGKLFIVGDPKQSIYRFRRADIEVYNEARSVLAHAGASLVVGATHASPVRRSVPAQAGACLEVSQNFRSRPGVAAWVNNVFSEVMKPSDAVDYTPQYVPIHAYRTDDGSCPRLFDAVRTIDIPEADSVEERRALEALRIAGVVDLIMRDAWQVFDRQEARWRRARPGDVAILVERLINLDEYERALERYGLPFRVEGGRDFYRRSELADLAVVLSAIDDPADELALIGTLRSGLFAFSDEELFLYKRDGGAFNYLAADPHDNTFATAFELLGRLHRQRNERPIARTILDLMKSTHALTLAALGPRKDAAVANLHKALEQARGFDLDAVAFRSYVRWLNQMARTTPREEEGAPGEEKEDAVRLMTLHKSKGLEFPIVVLANLVSRGGHAGSALIDNRTQRVEFRISLGDRKIATPGYADAVEYEKAHSAAERNRLCYVGATRARDYLIVPNHLGSKLYAHKELAAVFDRAQGASPIPVDSLRSPSRAAPVISVPDDAAESPSAKKARREKDRWRRKRHETIERARAAPEMLIPSEAWQDDRQGRALSAPPDESSTPSSTPQTSSAVSSAAQGSAAMGSAVHLALQRVALNGTDLIEVALRAGEECGLTADAAGQVEALARRALSSDYLERARRSLRVFREMPFRQAQEDRIVTGRIDLLFEEPDGLVIVDYKTDDVTAEDLDERFEFHAGQGRLYARAVGDITGKPVVEVAFLFLRPNLVRSISRDELGFFRE